MIDSRSKLLNWFFLISLVIFVLMIGAIVVWAAFFGGWEWLGYWLKQILK
jgi:hypothetical protein